MIVKNEAPVIRRCLASVLPWIDSWVIVDTGSTDGTQEIIRDYLKEIPGELHERPWVDFSTNRNQARILALGKSDYLLLIDADDELSVKPGFTLPSLQKDFYFVYQENPHAPGHANICNLLLINRDVWLWKWVLHERIFFGGSASGERLAGVTNLYHQDGERNKDSNKVQRDITVLIRALEKDPHNEHYLFNLAQTYRFGGQPALALEAYKKRAQVEGLADETFYSLYWVARLEQEHACGPFLASFWKAHSFQPDRIEPLYYLALYYLHEGSAEKAYHLIQKALAIRASEYVCFPEPWIQEWGIYLLLGRVAYRTRRFEESYFAFQKVAKAKSAPKDTRKSIALFFRDDFMLRPYTQSERRVPCL